MAASSPTSTALQRAFFALGTVVLVTAILYFAKIVLVPLAVAVLLAFVLTPPALWLEQHRFRRAASVPLVSILAFLVLGAALWVVGAQVRNLADKIGEYEKNVTAKLAPLYTFFDEIEKVGRLGEKIPAPVPRDAENQGTPANPMYVIVQPRRSVLSWLPALAGPVLESAAQSLLVVVLTVFILFQRENFRDRIIRLIGRRHLTSTTKAMGDAAERVSRYLLLQVATNTLMGLGVTLGLFLLGMDYALLWGVLAAALRFVPYVGIWLAMALPLMVSIAVSPTWIPPLLVLAIFLALELVMANVVEPLWFGNGVGVTPMALLVAAVFWLWLWGPIGLLLSAPLTVCLVVLGNHVPVLKFVDVLLGDQPALGPAARYYQRLLAGDHDEAGLLVDDYLRKHPPENVYDEVLLPAIVHARIDREVQEVTANEERAIFHATRGLLDNVLAHVGPVSPEAIGETPVNVNGRAEAPRLECRVVGCAVHGEADELALSMFAQLLQPAGCELELVSAKELLEEGKFAREAQRPDILCVASLPPG
ncbi:MAG TPA: AI-2E family transporter, partial [Gemmataceae bacterium]|nr:AI-2E family transporter [Gemmataceae bacterium]